MRVVLDTNVVMSGTSSLGPRRGSSPPGQRMSSIFWRASTSWQMYRRVAGRLRKKYPSVDLDPVLDLITRESRIVEPVPIQADACSDKDDLKFLACALAGNADCVVSGDRALLRASGYEGIVVITPSDFLTRFLDE